MPSTQKVIIVTGGGRGIGAGIVHELLKRNCKVVVAEIRATSKTLFPKNSSRLLVIKTDVKKEHSVRKMIQKTVHHFGQIDALINNAGILPDHRTPIEELSLKQWNATLDVNLTGVFLCAKHAVPYLRKQKGCIINLASTRVFQSEANTEPYSASKGGIVALTHALAISLGPDIRVNCISPGWIQTHPRQKLKPIDHRQHPVGRVGKVEDIAAMTWFLLSQQTGFITGQNFCVDGGMTKKMIYTE